MLGSMIVLGIETTCDETAAAVVVDGKKILSSVIHSQIPLHRQYGGVFPEVASRSHVDKLPIVIKEALKQAKISMQDVDLVSVAMGPGLIGPLLIGVNGAKALSFGLNVPFVGVNHIEAHLYAAMMGESDPVFPALGIVVSGGHTFLALIEDIGSYKLIGTTVDDAIGEAFDKVGKLLSLPYPGGPHIEKLAKQGDAKAYPFKAGKVKKLPYAFSFSGLKTNVFYSIHGQNGGEKRVLSEKEKADIAASFQETALKDVAEKAKKAAEEFGVKAIYVGGGVSCNQRLQELLKGPLPLFFPPKGLSLDNGAMIAGLGYHLYKKEGKSDPMTLTPKTRIPLALPPAE